MFIKFCAYFKQLFWRLTTFRITTLFEEKKIRKAKTKVHTSFLSLLVSSAESSHDLVSANLTETSREKLSVFIGQKSHLPNVFVKKKISFAAVS